MKLHGTMNSDDLKMTYGYDRVFAGRGDDEVFLFNSLNAVVRGGEGVDTFEFRVFDDQTYSVSRSGDITTLVIEGEGYHQEIVLKDFEKILVHELDF